jgi:hypothetical protein
MNEFEEITIKKFIKYFLLDSIYNQMNFVCGKFGISNSEISEKIGWDPAVYDLYDQEYRKSNDLKIITFIKICVAIEEIIKERKLDHSDAEQRKVHFDELITQKEIDLCRLHNCVSAVAGGRDNTDLDGNLAQVFLSMKPFVLTGKKEKKFTDKETDVYVTYYKALANADIQLEN